MLDLTCCGCGIAVPNQIATAITTEFNRRDEEAEEGFPIPIAGVLCVPCEVEMRVFLENRPEA